MRTTIVLLAVAVLAVMVLAQCRPQEEAAASDSAAPDSARRDDTTSTDTNPTDRSPTSVSAARTDTPRATRSIRRATDSATDSLPPDDSVRAMRPEMPQVTPPKRPRTWRGFKLPEEMPVRAPVETIKQVEQVPDSVVKGDPTKPPPPTR